MNHPSRYVVLESIVCVLLLAPAASGQFTSGNLVAGKVRGPSGQPIAGVMVELQTGTGALMTQTHTSNEGDYAFSGLEGASFVLVVNDPNYEPVSERVELMRTATTRPGASVRVDILLRPKPGAAASRAGTVFHQDVPADAVKPYRQGVKLLAERKSEEGIAALGEAIRIFPKYFDAHFALGLEMFRLGRYDDAIKELEQARAVNPKDSRLYHTFGLVLFEQKKYALSAAVFQAATQLNQTNAEAHLMRGAALIEIAQLNEAEEEIRRADKISAHKLAMVHFHLARVYEKRGDRARAAAELERYLKMTPDAKNADAIRAAIKTLRSPAKQ